MALLEKYLGLEKRAGWTESDWRWWHDIGWAKQSASGVTVNEKAALYSSAVYACVRLLAETVSSLPLVTYRRQGPRGKARAAEFYLYEILHDRPNPEMNSMSFREALQGHLCLWGNAFAEIDWTAGGFVRGLWPLRPDRMKVGRDTTMGTIYTLPESVPPMAARPLVYVYTLPDGSLARLPAHRVLHIPGFGFNGLLGYSPIALAREAIGLAMATEEFGARFFGNGARPGGVLEHPGILKDEAQERLRASWNDMHQGLSNQHRIAILEEGMKYHQVGVPPEDAQFLETRRFQLNEIARIFHVPPHMIGDLERATFSNIEHQGIEFVTYTLRPWLVRWEQALRQKLMGPDERKVYFAEHVVDGLLRGDIQARYQAYATAKQWGWMSSNDIRDLENMNPIEGGDVYYIPLNMMPSGETVPPEDLNPAINARAGLSQGDDGAGGFTVPKNGAKARARTAASYEHVFKDAAGRVLEREIAAVRRAARKYLSERSAVEFDSWLDDFYADLPAYIRKQGAPVAKSLAQAISEQAAEEINGKAPELDVFLERYLEALGVRHVDSSKGQLKKVAREAVQAGGDALGAVEGRLEEWEKSRAARIALNETVQLSNAVARQVFAGAGITKLTWQTLGSESCPICQEMDGRTVGIDESFVSADTTLQAEGQSSMKAYRPATHPPLHQGCICQVGPA